MTQRIFLFIDLVRLDRPIGIFLLFFPCAFGVGLAYENYNQLIWYLALFLLGSVIMRSAGCIVNDLFDRDIDRFVVRTKNRPLASKKIKISEALLLLSMLLVVGLNILLILSKTATLIGLLAFLLLLVYPLAKRFTYWPQLILGVTYNLGALIGYTAIKGDIAPHALVAYIGCVFWTLGYDTIYAFMDIKDDIKIGVKSSAIAIVDKNYRLFLGIIYFLFHICISYATYISSYQNLFYGQIPLLISLALMLWQVMSLDISSADNCMQRFKNNSYVGLLVAISVIISRSI